MATNLIVILGPTASGKTRLAARLACDFNGEIISADSRQVYRNMNIGTGKDLNEYIVEGKQIPYHLIDVVEPEDEFNVFEFQKQFYEVFHCIHKRNRMPVLVGGTGLYLESVLFQYDMPEAPIKAEQRKYLKMKTKDELQEILFELKPQLHNKTDLGDTGRLIRAIEIERVRSAKNHGYEPQGKPWIITPPQEAGCHTLHSWRDCSTYKFQYTSFLKFKSHDHNVQKKPKIVPVVFGIKWDRAELRHRITKRLEERLNQGMIDEILHLHSSGLSWSRLESFGLEYRFISQYAQRKITFDEMKNKLNIAIHQFAKRQETWFRRMEKKGLVIKWIENDDYQILKESLLKLLK